MVDDAICLLNRSPSKHTEIRRSDSKLTGIEYFLCQVMDKKWSDIGSVVRIVNRKLLCNARIFHIYMHTHIRKTSITEWRENDTTIWILKVKKRHEAMIYVFYVDLTLISNRKFQAKQSKTKNICALNLTRQLTLKKSRKKEWMKKSWRKDTILYKTIMSYTYNILHFSYSICYNSECIQLTLLWNCMCIL